MKNTDIINYFLFQPDLRTFNLNPKLVKYPIGTLNIIFKAEIASLTLQKFPGRKYGDLLESPLRYRHKDGTLVC